MLGLPSSREPRLGRDQDAFVGMESLMRDFTFRPRTYGITLTWHR
jgi:hypothetical protein